MTIWSDGLVRQYEDGAQLYACVFHGPARLLQHAAGRAKPVDDGDFALQLFHVTNTDAARAIRDSHELRSSAWNLQGTRKLANVAYLYLTSLPDVRTESDLARIAMSSTGVLNFQTTSLRETELKLELTVYRESTTGRPASLPVTIASSLLSPPHLLLHPKAGDAYYEVVGPEIYRVGVEPGIALFYESGAATIDGGALKRFTHLVMGNAAELDGLAAPYDEENTEQVIHLEPLGGGTDLFGFWQAHPNSDQVSWRALEKRMFLP